MWHDLFTIRSLSAFLLVLLLVGGNGVLAYVASSTNYRIQFDSVNMGGGLSTSTSYRMEDTLGEAGTGTSSSATYRLKAGYQQMQESSIAVTIPGNITLAPSIPTSGGGVANGQATWTIITDNPAGYTASIRASTSPALISGPNSFADYTPATANPDFLFSVASTSSEFGFSPEGVDIVQRFLDNGSACNVGSGETTDRCWDALSTIPMTVASRATANHPAGTTVTIKFRAESGVANIQPPGEYQATTTMTIMPR
jgi:hypothetical protein